MKKNISYSSLVVIEAHLEEALKQCDREILLLKKHAPESDRIERLVEDRENLREAISQLTEYETYVANYEVTE